MRTTAYRRHKTYHKSKRFKEILNNISYYATDDIELGKLRKRRSVYRYIYRCGCNYCNSVDHLGRTVNTLRQPQLYDHDYDNYEE